MLTLTSFALRETPNDPGGSDFSRGSIQKEQYHPPPTKVGPTGRLTLMIPVGPTSVGDQFKKNSITPPD